MENQSKKAMCFVCLPPGLPRELMPSITLENLDAAEICDNLGVKSFIVHIAPVRFTKQEDVKFTEYMTIEGLPEKMPNRIDSLAGYNLLLRSWKDPTPFVLRAIEMLGGKNELSLEDYRKVIEWPAYVSQDYTQRAVGIMPLSEVADSAAKYAVEGKVFVKTAEKLQNGHGMVAALEDALRISSKGIPYIRDGDKKKDKAKVGPETQIILSQPVSFKKDTKGNLEYRAWVFNNQVLAIRRYGNPNDSEVPPAISDFSQSFAEAHAGILPPHYVVDAGIAKKLGPLVVEVNDIMYAGNTTPDIFGKILEKYLG